MSILARNIILNTGNVMPILGLGTYICDKGQRGQLGAAVDFALSIGYKLIDTAYSYANEDIIGDVLKDRRNAGGTKRKDIFITTKIPLNCLHKDKIRHAIDESLGRLQTTYVDLLLLHGPWAVKDLNDYDDRELVDVDLNESWATLKQVQDNKLTKAIGLSNFNATQIERLSSSNGVRPACIQSECHAYYQQHLLKQYADKHGIAFTAYGPLGSAGRSAHNILEDSPVLLEDPILKKLSDKYNKTPSQCLLRNLIQRDFAVIPKSVTPERIQENLDVFDFEIDDEDMKLIETMDKHYKYFLFNFARKHSEFDANQSF